MAIDRAALIADRVGTVKEEYEIPGVGVIVIRGLSRFAILVGQKKYPDDMLAQERWTLSQAIVEPSMTEADVEAWQRSSPPQEINGVALAVNRLSGISEGAQKSDVSELRGES